LRFSIEGRTVRYGQEQTFSPSRKNTESISQGKTMKTVEVNEKKWREFCKRIEEFCRGAAVTIELENDAGDKRMIAQDVPLRGLSLEEEADPCNTNLVIEAGLPDQKPIRHVVLEPIHIRLRNREGTDRYNRLQISAENGVTNVELHPGLNQALLNRLQV
jgi:hypothetical protein